MARTRPVAGVIVVACAMTLAAGAVAGASGTAHGRATVTPTPPCAGAQTAPNGADSALIDAATLCLMNQIRVADGLHPLHRNGALAAVATGQVRDMIRGDYFGDQSLSGQTPFARIRASSYRLARSPMRLMAAQNIGWGTGPNATPAGIVQAWMESPPHRAIILSGAYRDAGVGVVAAVPAQFSSGWNGGTYAVEFAERAR